MLAHEGERAGAHSGEGAAMMVVEPIDAARARGATCWAAVTGYGTAFEAPDDLAALCAPSQLALERAIGDALADAGVQAGEVDLVVTGLSGWSRTDDPERAALRATIGDEVCMAAPKQRVGETLGASGALAMAATVAWMHGAPITCLVQGAAPSRMRTVLVTSMGFYGNASAVVLRRAENVS
jgi:3-oxoacyl-(acyl-carrier-protein) synthase